MMTTRHFEDDNNKMMINATFSFYKEVRWVLEVFTNSNEDACLTSLTNGCTDLAS